MRDRLLAYLLNDLEPAERTELEELLAADPDLQQELEKMRSCLASCEEAEAEKVAPTQLASRTCSFVEHAIQKSKSLCHHSAGATSLSGKSLSESRDNLRTEKRWTLADMVVGACVLVALGTLVLPSLRVNRDVARRLTCQNNMHQLGAALMNYSLQFNQGLPRIEPGENAGTFVITLADSGTLTREQLAQMVVCPSTQLADRVTSGCVVIRIPTREEFLTAEGAERDQLRKFMAGDYAYSLGYRDPRGQIQQVHFSGSRHIPLLSDSPSQAIAGYQSANHGGCGQNVLFQDLSVKYCTQCKCKAKRDHWFLNDDGQVAAGSHVGDMVLGGSAATPIVEISAK
jgi:hypothetical protein